MKIFTSFAKRLKSLISCKPLASSRYREGFTTKPDWLRYALIISTACLFAGPGMAQRVQVDTEPSDSTKTDSLQHSPFDTLPVFLFAERQMPSERQVQDSSLSVLEMQYDPTRRQNIPLAQTGNLGSPAGTISSAPTFSFAERQNPLSHAGLNIGLHAFDSYHFYPDSLYFYRRNRAFTQASFSQGPTQEDLMIGLHFGRSFGDAMHFGVRFRRINNSGYFTHLKSFSDALLAGLLYHKAGGRYYGLAYFAHNENRQEDNGGISAEATDVFGNTVVAPPQQLEINTPQANTRLAKNSYTYSQYLQLFKGVDSTGGKPLRPAPSFSNGWYLNSRSAVESFEYKFYDDAPSPNQSVYGSLSNERGMRLFLRNLRLSQELDLLYHTAADSSSRAFRAGLRYEANRLQIEPKDTSLALLYATTKGLWAGQKLKFEWKGFYALAGERSAYFGSLSLRWACWQVKLIGLERQAAQTSQRMFITQKPVWEQKLQHEKLFLLGFSSELADQKLRLGLSFSRLQNFVYLDTSFYPVQRLKPIQTAQVSLQSRLQWGILHYEQETLLGLSSSYELPVPGLYSRQRLYLRGLLFRGALEFLLGSELSLLSPYRLKGYQQALGTFYQSYEQKGWQPFLSGFVAGRIKNIHFYFILENLLPPLTGQYYYLLAKYPQPQLGLRFGLSASFRG